MTKFTPPQKRITKLYHPEFQAWVDMRWRCSKDSIECWDHYGGRGIIVCEQWQNSFRTFLTDMGPRPSKKHSLDRINNDGNYTPENCRWATRSEQQRNRQKTQKLTFNGETLPVVEWAERLGWSHHVLFTRIKRGWPVSDILTIPPYGRYKNAMTATIDGRTQNVRQWAKELGFRDIGIIYDRIKRGWSIEKALLTPADSRHATYKK